MRSRKIILSNFSHAVFSESQCLRPDNEQQLLDYMAHNHPTMMLARGFGLSYSDSCLNKEGLVIDTSRFNHLLDFDPNLGIVTCEAAVSFKDLFLVHPEFIPPVLPGTLYATIAGGIAQDIHGKNNPRGGSIGQHLIWVDLLVGDTIIRCSRDEHSDLFYATIGGLGLTGIILRCALRLKKASRFVQVENRPFESLRELIKYMAIFGLNSEYQVAWLDLLNNSPRGILSIANPTAPFPYKEKPRYVVPKLPGRIINSWGLKLYNGFFFRNQRAKSNMTLAEFNNPLDKITHWNRLYGPKGLLQFQAVFAQEDALEIIEHLLQLIKNYRAIPTLAVLKLFTQSGEGMLSFCRPGFTIAIDFANNTNSKNAIRAMNQCIAEMDGRIYLAKDLLLSPEQFHIMYPNEPSFSDTLVQYHSVMQSDLARRLGIIK